MQDQKSQFLLSNVLKNYKLNQNEIAHVMFPLNQNPDSAIKRLLKGEGKISLDMLEALARYIGISVPTLYWAGCDTWSDVSLNSIENFSIEKGVYSANYNFNSRRLVITVTNTTLFNEVIGEEKISAYELINTINSIIDGSYSN